MAEKIITRDNQSIANSWGCLLRCLTFAMGLMRKHTPWLDSFANVCYFTRQEKLKSAGRMVQEISHDRHSHSPHVTEFSTKYKELFHPDSCWVAHVKWSPNGWASHIIGNPITIQNFTLEMIPLKQDWGMLEGYCGNLVLPLFILYLLWD